ncbi:hypothetical protein LMG28690_07319 [Paraburkholderia caffeinilytica]|nr:hypothetical protein LMG28690_07319 [Paraburkholderia caffeinilytica]
MSSNILHKRIPRPVQVLNSNRKTPLRSIVKQIIRTSLPIVRPIEIRPSPQHRNAIQIDLIHRGRALKRLIRRVILLLRGAIHAVAVRQNPGPIPRPLPKQRPRPPGIARQRVALNDSRRPIRRRIRILGPRSLRLSVIGQHNITRQGKCRIGQLGVQLKHLRPIVERRLIRRTLGIDAQVPGIPARRNLPPIDLPLNPEVDQILRPRRGSDRALLRIDPGNPRHHKVRMPQIETRREGQRHDRRGSVAMPHASGHDAHVLLIAVNRRIIRR